MRPVDAYKVLTVCYTGTYPWLKRFSKGRVELRHSELRKKLDCRIESLRSCFRFLENQGYIKNVTFNKGYLDFIITPPKVLLDHLGYVEAGSDEN